MDPTPSPGSLTAVKPAALRMDRAAVLTNRFGACTPSETLVEYDGVKSLEDASSMCRATSGCTHFTLDVSGSRSAPATRSRVRLCAGEPRPVDRDGAVLVVSSL
ncbi:unnamed protein product [Prorocentrum cordatum]|uniref:Uncharacterized protein n=1 Tax=Prorocentrum cordatum TaxID=2364126 RepID=A0ABN9UCL7_9DINO|nr:unnamed protein product [Polarella glacialis]